MDNPRFTDLPEEGSTLAPTVVPPVGEDPVESVVHPSNLSWKDAIRYVLKYVGEPMTTTAIADKISEWGLRANVIANPVPAVNTVMRKHLVTEVEQTEDGTYRLNDEAEALISLDQFSSKPENAADIAEDEKVTQEVSKENNSRLIRSQGIFWSRNEVIWRASQEENRLARRSATQLWGRASTRAPIIDFGSQPGIYILYNGNQPIYVGQADDGRLADRIGEHTRDRLKSRWDTFSWFGLKGVRQDSAELEAEVAYSLQSGNFVKQLIDALEGLLIEGVEPVQNRRQGNGFKAIEFLQVTDPALERIQLQAPKLAEFVQSTLNESY